MPNPIAENTHTTASANEETIYAGTTNRVTQLTISVDAMVAGDVFVIREKSKVLSGGSALLVKTTTLAGVDGGLPGSAVVFQTDPLSGVYGVTYTIDRDAGSDRAFPYRVDEL